MELKVLIILVACFSCLLAPAFSLGILATKLAAAKGVALLGAKALVTKGAVAIGAAKIAAKGALLKGLLSSGSSLLSDKEALGDKVAVTDKAEDFTTLEPSVPEDLPSSPKTPTSNVIIEIRPSFPIPLARVITSKISTFWNKLRMLAGLKSKLMGGVLNAVKTGSVVREANAVEIPVLRSSIIYDIIRSPRVYRISNFRVADGSKK